MNVIEVRGLSKKYRIGRAERRSDTLTGALVEGLRSPLRNLKEIRDLTRLDDVGDSINWALRDVSFDVKEGEVLGIIGRNGAGKSTLLKILSRITEPSSGEVRIIGRVAALLEVGTGFHPELTGRENIYMNGTILGMRKKEIDRKLEEIVNFSGVETYLDTPVKFYSSGMRVRLGFSVAAHLEPEIMIIDEVLAVGDAEFQKKCLGKMEDVAGNGRTVLFVSHNMTAIQNLCVNGLVLRNGVACFHGPIKEAVHTYLREYSTNKVELLADGLSNFENDQMRFISARILNDGFIETSHRVRFEFIFEYKRSDAPLIDVTFHLFDEMNSLLFVGSSGYDLNVRASQREMKFVCEIPGDLLLEGNYRIGRLLFIKDKGHVLLSISDALSFDVISSGSGRFGWSGGKQGVIQPKLQWKVGND